MHHKRALATGQRHLRRHLHTGQGLPHRIVQTELVAFVQGNWTLRLLAGFFFFGLTICSPLAKPESRKQHRANTQSKRSGRRGGHTRATDQTFENRKVRELADGFNHC